MLMQSPKNVVTMYPIDARDLQDYINKAIKRFKGSTVISNK